MMERIYLGAALFIGLAVLSAGCGGSARKAASYPTSYPITVQGTTTIANVKTGTLVSCKGGFPKTKVPPAAHEVGAIEDGATSSAKIQIAHQQDGSIVVTCRE
jgi:hypothetical protein